MYGTQTSKRGYSRVTMLLGRTDKGNPLKGLRYAWIKILACRR